MIGRRAFLGLMLVLPTMVAQTGPAMAETAKVYALGGTAINGYDPVAYFTAATPTKGEMEISSSWNGATWQFSSAGNKALFDANPEKYAPQYGGYCAYAVSKGATAPTDPDAWTVVDDKLYLNFSLDVRGIWRQDVSGNISRANANWPAVLQ